MAKKVLQLLVSSMNFCMANKSNMVKLGTIQLMFVSSFPVSEKNSNALKIIILWNSTDVDIEYYYPEIQGKKRKNLLIYRMSNQKMHALPHRIQ